MNTFNFYASMYAVKCGLRCSLLISLWDAAPRNPAACLVLHKFLLLTAQFSSLHQFSIAHFTQLKISKLLLHKKRGFIAEIVAASSN